MALIVGGKTTSPFLEATASAPPIPGAPSFLLVRVVLVLFAVLALGEGFRVLVFAKSAIHEIEAYLAFGVGSVLFCTACIIDAIRRAMLHLKG